jgi:outer membrane protein OmpA-like peptidoglycan-associated protein
MFQIVPRLFIILSIVFIFPFHSKCQNLFFNPNFEELNLCIEYNQLCSPAAWFYIKPAATPFINANMVPQPFSGKDLLILPVENIYKKISKRAFVTTMFCCALKKGKKYKLSFYMHTGVNKFYGVDFYMRSNEFLSNNFLPDSVKPTIHISLENIVNEVNGWSYVETMYTATGGEQYCLLGNLSKNAFEFPPTSRMNKAGDVFYFIDVISFAALEEEALCKNYKENVEKTYGQQLRHTERTMLDSDTMLSEFITDTITIPAVFFETDKAVLKPAFKKLIDDLVFKFKNKNIAKIIIEGHTDNTGTEARNIILSNDRAKSVLNYFVQQSPNLKDYIFAFGKASNFPIADNNTAKGKSKNRRVQIFLTYSLPKKLIQ